MHRHIPVVISVLRFLVVFRWCSTDPDQYKGWNIRRFCDQPVIIFFLRDFTDVLDQYKVWHIRHKGGELVIVLFFCWTRGIIIIKKIKWALCKYTCTWGGQEWTISRTFSYERNRTRIFLHGLSLIIERNRTHKTIGKINLIERIAFD